MHSNSARYGHITVDDIPHVNLNATCYNNSPYSFKRLDFPQCFMFVYSVYVDVVDVNVVDVDEIEKT